VSSHEITDVEHQIAHHAAEIMNILRLPPDSEDSLRNTPVRFAKYLMEFRQPHVIDELLATNFAAPEKYNGMITQGDIPFRGLCEHHLCPFFGKAYIGYIPNKLVVGLSKLVRLVDAAGIIRPSMQETINDLIADKLNEAVEPKGVIVVIRAVHTCMSVRGVAAPNVPTTTSSVRGLYLTVPPARDEFMRLVGL
jgi:GTP cyclohydrolase IA